jgi:hypothetical protein
MDFGDLAIVPEVVISFHFDSLMKLVGFDYFFRGFFAL